MTVLFMTAVAEDTGGPLVKKDNALTGAALSAAIGVAAYGLRKAIQQRDEHDQAKSRDENGRASGSSLLIAAVQSASDSLLPLAEAVAEEAGRWVAKHSPPAIRDRLLPRFIEAFKAAA